MSSIKWILESYIKWCEGIAKDNIQSKNVKVLDCLEHTLHNHQAESLVQEACYAMRLILQKNKITQQHATKKPYLSKQ